MLDNRQAQGDDREIMNASTQPQGAMPSELWAERKAKVWTTIAELDSPKLTDAREDVDLALWQNGHPQLDTIVHDLRIRQMGWNRIPAEVKLMTMGSTSAPTGLHRSGPTYISWFPHYNKPAYEILGWAPELAAAAR